MLDLIQGSIFQRAKIKEDEKKHLEAAKLYESLTVRYPKSKYADKALFNAAMNYISADASEQAIATSNKFWLNIQTGIGSEDVSVACGLLR
ncbi:MAG: hypothetical protein R2877_02255 [Bdellovibrionota bacterium]